MTPIQLNFYLFIITILVFAWIGFSAAKKHKTPGQYFHHDSLRKNIVSLIATNITLGTGLVYLISGAHQNGLLMLLPVLCVGIGYWLLAEYLERATTVAARTGKNFLASIDDEIARVTQQPSLFGKAVSLSIISVFVMLLAFEIFASSKVISPFLFTNPSLSSEALLSSIIFLITVTYAVLGGVHAIFGVDKIQVPLILLFLPVFLIAAIPDWNQPIQLAERLAATFKSDINILIAIGIACINALATQFYSILNWGAVSNVELERQQKMLRWVGSLTTIVLILFVLVGLLHPVGSSGQPWEDLIQHFSEFGKSFSINGFLVSAIIMLGMASILLTSTDAIVVNSILFYYDNVSGGDSKAQESDQKALRRIRIIGGIAFGICFVILSLINYLQPEPFYLLLSMAGGVVVFSPVIVTAGFLTRIENGLRVFSRKVIGGFIVLFIFTGIVDALLLMQKSHLVPYVGLVAFAISSSVCLGLLWRARLPSR